MQRLTRMFGNQFGQAERLYAGMEDGEVPTTVASANTAEIQVDDIELE